MLLLSSLFIITIIIQNLDISFNYIDMYMYEWIGFWCYLEEASGGFTC